MWGVDPQHRPQGSQDSDSDSALAIPPIGHCRCKVGKKYYLCLKINDTGLLFWLGGASLNSIIRNLHSLTHNDARSRPPKGQFMLKKKKS